MNYVHMVLQAIFKMNICRYLELLKDKQVYPCITDREDVVISFPPITNCHATKVFWIVFHIE